MLTQLTATIYDALMGNSNYDQLERSLIENQELNGDTITFEYGASNKDKVKVTLHVTVQHI